MNHMLDTIVTDVRRRLAERKRRVPLHEIREAEARPRPSFLGALSLPGLSLIAEIKRASPSKGTIRDPLDAADLARRYERAGARAVSVLTEQDHFRGGPEDLRQAVSATSLPILQKDFVVDEYQIYEARAWGASAVLLIVALLETDELKQLAETARGAGLNALVEVHDEDELKRALGLEGAIIGINNRDLRNFEVSLDTTFRLVSMIPPEVPVVSESGVRSREDFRRLEAAGIDGVLVGEHLVAREDIEEAVRELIGSSTPSDEKGPA
ncbi:MAG: indole-3-glycerol phosphate synthase TrpC [Thermoleophilia bacterium]